LKVQESEVEERAKIDVYPCERIARQAVFGQKKKQRVIFIFALFSSELERKDAKWYQADDLEAI